VIVVCVGGCVAAAWTEGAPLVPDDAGRAAGGGLWVTVFLACLAVAFLAYLLALMLLRRAAPRLSAVAAVAVGIQLLPLGAPLLLSTDAWAYWEYGAIASSGGNPYRETPSERPENPAYEHAGYDWRDTTSVYGPAFTLLSEGVAKLSESSEDAAAWSFKALAALSMLSLTALAALLSRERAFAAAFVGWNPLLAIHFAGGGHNDALMLTFVLAALALGAQRHRTGAAVAWVLAVFVKWIPVVFFALRALEARATGRSVAHVPFAMAAAAIAGLATWRYGIDWLGAFGPLARNAEGQTRFALPQRLEQVGLPQTLTLAVAAAVLAAGVVWLAYQALHGRARLGLAACLLLLTTPWLVPWYAVWAVPLAAAEDDRRAQLVSLGLCAYLLPQTIPL
jgi:alpha-1,6-mannosyltransferase